MCAIVGSVTRKRDENTSPLGRIILARAAAVGARRTGKDLSLKDMSDLAAEHGVKLTRGAINEWILGRVRNPTPELMLGLAAALADYDYSKLELYDDMRAAVGMPPHTAPLHVDVSNLAPADVDMLNALADRLRDKGAEAAAAATAATERATGFTATTVHDLGRRRGRDDTDAVAAAHSAG